MLGKSRFIEESLQKSRGVLSKDGALMVETGPSTGRSTKERFVARRPEVESDIQWGKVNKEISPEFADTYFETLKKHVMSSPNYSMEGYVGCFKIKVYSTSSWHVAFAENMFREDFIESVKDFVRDDLTIEVYHEPDLKVSDLGLSHEYEKAIILDPANLKVGIIGTAYGGEIKKSAFTLCNFLFPKYGVLPMHSSANCKVDGSESSILFGLSGTGKTTLSADPHRCLIGDDEIIWTNKGLSNLEGGCYAKLINLDSEKEPDIFKAANRYGSILENVCFNEATKEIDFCDNSKTENTRASYSIDALDCVFDQTTEAKHPTSIIFLTADAFGALPAVARLDEWQAQYHFISGYTAKVAGTEIGVTEPQATFSACFGAPFMPRSAAVYGQMLAEKAKAYDVPVWLLNTGWFGGGYGEGERFPIPVSRAILSAIQTGELNNVEMTKHPIFGFEVPKSVPGVDCQYLAIPDNEAVYTLAKKFVANASTHNKSFTEEVVDKGGPKVLS